MSLGGIDNNSNGSTRNNFNIISFIFILFLFSTLILFAFYWNSQSRIKRFEVVNLHFFRSEPIETLLAKYNNQKVDLEAIKSLVEKLDFVDLCKVYKKNSETVVVEVVEKEPIALVCDTNGKLLAVSSNFTLISSEYLISKSYPVVYNANDYSLLRLLKWLKNKYPNVYSSIAEISKNGSELCLLIKSTRTKVRMKEESCTQKFEFLSELFKRKDFSKFLKKEIDLRMENLMVLR